MKRLAASIYLLAGLASAFVCFQSLMWAVWGAPTHWTQYVGLIASLVTAVGACRLLISKEKGQGICVAGIIGMGSFYIPAVQSLIPAENIIISPLNYVILASYLALVAAGTLYPKRIRGAVGVIIFVVVAMSAWASLTAFSRWKEGEFNRPQIIGFLAARSTETLVVPEEYDRLIPATWRDGITKAGVGGRLNWRSGAEEDIRSTKVVIIATSRIKTPKELRYPKQGTIVYVWNGEQWTSLPKDADCYSAFATLQVNGMISNELTTGGVQSYYFFPWQIP